MVTSTETRKMTGGVGEESPSFSVPNNAKHHILAIVTNNTTMMRTTRVTVPTDAKRSSCNVSVRDLSFWVAKITDPIGPFRFLTFWTPQCVDVSVNPSRWLRNIQRMLPFVFLTFSIH